VDQAAHVRQPRLNTFSLLSPALTSKLKKAFTFCACPSRLSPLRPKASPFELSQLNHVNRGVVHVPKLDTPQSAHLEPLQVAPDLFGPAAGAERGAVLGAGHLELDVELEDGAQPIAAARADGAPHQPHQLLRDAQACQARTALGIKGVGMESPRARLHQHLTDAGKNGRSLPAGHCANLLKSRSKDCPWICDRCTGLKGVDTHVLVTRPRHATESLFASRMSLTCCTIGQDSILKVCSKSETAEALTDPCAAILPAGAAVRLQNVAHGVTSLRVVHGQKKDPPASREGKVGIRSTQNACSSMQGSLTIRPSKSCKRGRKQEIKSPKISKGKDRDP
jgi:hypothetical protein